MAGVSSQQRTGTAIGHRFVLGNPVTQTEIAVTYAALDSLRDLSCTVKLPNAASQNDGAIEHLRREMVVTSKLWHHNIVHVLDTGTTEDGLPFIATEELQGSSLHEHLRNEGPMDAQQALILLLPVMGALAKAHTTGIIHCSIQPANLFIHETSGGQLIPKLLDFSAAFVEDDALHVPSQCAPSPNNKTYTAPEHRTDPCEPSPRIDVWSMSAVLYHCVMGHPPAEADGSIDEDALHKRVGNALGAALAQGLSLQPERRYPTMTHMARALLEAAWRQNVALPIDPDPDGLPAASDWRDEWFRRLERDRPTHIIDSHQHRGRYLQWMALAVVLVATTALVTASLQPSASGGMSINLRWLGESGPAQWLQSHLGSEAPGFDLSPRTDDDGVIILPTSGPSEPVAPADSE